MSAQPKSSAVGRNDPCPCGSGKKYKQCCLDKPSGSASGVVQQGADQRRPQSDVQQTLQAAMNLHQVGQLAEAEALYRQVLVHQPKHAGVLHLLGVIAHQMGKYEQATDLIAKAIHIAPSGMMHCNLGLALVGLGRDAQAVAQFRIAIALQPDYQDSYFNLGIALHNLGRLKEALNVYRQGLVRKPDDARAYASLAGIYLDLGEYEAARLEIDKALQIDPDAPLAWALLAGLRKMTLEDADWVHKAERLLPKISAEVSHDAITLQHAIGKFHDDTQQYDAAFAAHSRANALRRQREGGYDCAAFARLVDALIARYSSDFVRHQHAGASQSQRPVFIVGMPRSGTSLIEQIIASHPDTFGAGELTYWGALSNEDVLHGVAAADAAARIGKIAREYEQLLQGLSPTAKRVIDKMPGNYCWLGLIMSVFPHARVIHTQRNPVDTCLSIYFQNFNSRHSYATDLANLAQYYREYLRLMAHWRSVLPPDRFLEVPYEALTVDQEGWTRRIIAFLDLEWDASCLDFHATERKVGTSSNWQVRQKMYQSSKERWRHYEKHLGPLRGLIDDVGCASRAESGTDAPVREAQSTESKT